MQEHPNYKYRPRRRKHNKQRAGSPPTAVQGGASAAGQSPTPRRPNSTGQIKLAQYPSGSSPYQSSSSYSSPAMHQQQQQQQQQQHPYAYQPYSPSKTTSPYYPNSESPYSPVRLSEVITPESSPTCSPDPDKPSVASDDAGAAALQDSSGRRSTSKTPTLPTPELSPMEPLPAGSKDHPHHLHHHQQVRLHHPYQRPEIVKQEYDVDDFGGYYAGQKLANNNNHLHRQFNNNNNNSQTSSYQPVPGSIAAMGVAKGMVMMCTNQRLAYEHNNIVTGTFYPPIATSQDQQALVPSSQQHHHQQQQQQQQQQPSHYANRPFYSTSGLQGSGTAVYSSGLQSSAASLAAAASRQPDAYQSAGSVLQQQENHQHHNNNNSMQGLQQQQLHHRQQPTGNGYLQQHGGTADGGDNNMMEMNFDQPSSEMLLANVHRPRSQQSDGAATAVDVQTAAGGGTELDRYLKYMVQQPDSNHNYQQQQQQQQQQQHVMFAGIQQSHHHHHLQVQQQQQQQQQHQYNAYYAPTVQHVVQQQLQLQQQDHHHGHQQLLHGSSYLLNNCGVKSEFGGYASQLQDGLPPPQHYPDVQNLPATANMQSVAAAAAAGQVQLATGGGKPDEEFSVILADVRKTCYSS